MCLYWGRGWCEGIQKPILCPYYEERVSRTFEAKVIQTRSSLFVKGCYKIMSLLLYSQPFILFFDIPIDPFHQIPLPSASLFFALFCYLLHIPLFTIITLSTPLFLSSFSTSFKSVLLSSLLFASMTFFSFPYSSVFLFLLFFPVLFSCLIIQSFFYLSSPPPPIFYILLSSTLLTSRDNFSFLTDICIPSPITSPLQSFHSISFLWLFLIHNSFSQHFPISFNYSNHHYLCHFIFVFSIFHSPLVLLLLLLSLVLTFTLLSVPLPLPFFATTSASFIALSSSIAFLSASYTCTTLRLRKL